MYWKSDAAMARSLANIGKTGPMPEEIKEKIRKSKTGKSRSESERQAISKAMTGKKRKPFSEETLTAMRAGQAARRAREKEK